MDKKTKGAWIVHHSQKLDGVKLLTQDFAQIGFAGKCATMLNALAHSDQIDVDNQRIQTLAKISGINPWLELPAILDELEIQRMIDKSESGISILGLTTAQTLERTATIFDEKSPEACETAALEVAEMSSELPLKREDVEQFVSDTHHLPLDETDQIISQFEAIGFVDTEGSIGEPVIFNGNLFRREALKKVTAVMNSLSSNEEAKVAQLSENLRSAGCLPKNQLVQLLGNQLYSKLCTIGFIDENVIANEQGTYSFVTRPAAFSKFGNPAVEDAFDLAKAFVTSLTFGMTSSQSNRGRIMMIEALMRKLIDGQWVGPATAIGKDYKILELKGAIRVRTEPGGMFSMKLLKKDVGVLALEVISKGETGGDSLLRLPSVSATGYTGPEANRTVERRKQAEPLKQNVAQLLADLRTGGLQ